MKIVQYSIVLLVSCLLLLVPSIAHAAYVLPYPSFMPGNKVYKISRYIDVSRKWWSWGTIASLKYHQGLADKYLVEAKTLFEYKQYPLALDALARSDAHVSALRPLLSQGTADGKDMTKFAAAVDEEMTIHKSVIARIVSEVPETFPWQPERAPESNLLLHDILRQSYEIR